MIRKVGKLKYIVLLLLFLLSCRNGEDIPYFLFNTDDPKLPKILNSSPSTEMEEVESDTPLYVDFSTEMDKERTQNSFTISGTAPLDGYYKWENNRLYYVVEDGIPLGNHYTLKVTETAESKRGKRLQHEYIINFISGSTVVHPEVESTVPSDGSQSFPVTDPISVTFSRPMEHEVTQRAFSIAPATLGEYQWSDDSTVLTFVPYNPLQYGVDYRISISTSAADLEGLEMLSPYSFTFFSGEDRYGPEILAVYETGNPIPLVNGYSGFYKESGLRIIFAEPVYYTQTESAVSLRRKSDNLFINGNFEWNDGYDILTFTPLDPLTPESEYRLYISESAEDLAGNSMPDPYVLDFAVNNDSGAIASDYLQILSIRKVQPSPPVAPVETLLSGTAYINDITVDGTLADSDNAIAQINVVFSDSIDWGSFAESVYLNLIMGVNTDGSGSITGMTLDTTNVSNDTLIIHLKILGYNYYLLEILGGEEGIHTAAPVGEEPAYLYEDTKVIFRVQ